MSPAQTNPSKMTTYLIKSAQCGVCSKTYQDTVFGLQCACCVERTAEQAEAKRLTDEIAVLTAKKKTTTADRERIAELRERLRPFFERQFKRLFG